MSDPSPTDTQIIRRSVSVIRWVQETITARMFFGSLAAIVVVVGTFVGTVYRIGGKVDQVITDVAKLTEAIKEQKKHDTDFAALQQRVIDMDSRLNKLEAWKDFADREVDKPDPRLRHRR